MGLGSRPLKDPARSPLPGEGPARSAGLKCVIGASSGPRLVRMRDRRPPSRDPNVRPGLDGRRRHRSPARGPRRASGGWRHVIQSRTRSGALVPSKRPGSGFIRTHDAKTSGSGVAVRVRVLAPELALELALGFGFGFGLGLGVSVVIAAKCEWSVIPACVGMGVRLKHPF